MGKLKLFPTSYAYSEGGLTSKDYLYTPLNIVQGINLYTKEDIIRAAEAEHVEGGKFPPTNVQKPLAAYNSMINTPTFLYAIAGDLTDLNIEEIDYSKLSIVVYRVANNVVGCIHNAKYVKLGECNYKNLQLFSRELRKFEGDIIIDGGSGTGVVKLFQDSPIQQAIGQLVIKGVKEIDICHGSYSVKEYEDIAHTKEVVDEGDIAEGEETLPESVPMKVPSGGLPKLWFNVMDLRNVDTSSCTKFNLLSNTPSECIFILGNFSNENLTTIDTTLFMSSAPSTGRIVVMTKNTPPTFKNCNNAGKHTSNYDWIERGKIEKILVPEDAYDNYNEHLHVTSAVDALGNTIPCNFGENGWSYYGSYGKNIIETYDPSKQFKVKRVGDKSNGKPIWLYRK